MHKLMKILIFLLILLTVTCAEKLNGRFLVIGDIHYDAFYLENSSPAQYCHSGEGNAGKFGTFGRICDTPGSVIEQFAQFYTEQIEQNPIDFAVFIGDSSRHDIDPNVPVTQNESLAAVQYIQTMLQRTFTNIPVIFTIGNNDVYPDGQLSDKVGNEYLQNLSSIYSPFFSSSQKSDFSQYGHYTYQLTSHLSLIIMNTLYFYISNNLTQDCNNSSSAGYNELLWLNDTLKNLSDMGNQTVILIGHVPIKHYFQSCADLYTSMANKYNDIILAQIFGHEHKDEFFLVDNSQNCTKDSSFGGIYNVVPAVYTQYNPSPGRIYQFSPFYPHQIEGYSQYILNLTNSNNIGAATVQFEYNFPQFYNLSSCEYKSYLDLNTSITNNATVSNQYQFFQYTSVNTTEEIMFLNTIPGINIKAANNYISKIYSWYTPNNTLIEQLVSKYLNQKKQ